MKDLFSLGDRLAIALKSLAWHGARRLPSRESIKATEMILSFEGRTLRCDGREWTAEYPIQAAREVQGLVCLIFDHKAFPRHPQARNLSAYVPEGLLVWTAEHPTNTTADCYTSFVEGLALKAHNFAGFICELDPATGRLLEAKFTK